MSNLEASGVLVGAVGRESSDSAKQDLVRFIPDLQRQLTDPNLPLARRFRALFTLKNIGGLDAIKAIAAGFNGSSVLLKHECAYCMGQMQDSQANDFLADVLRDTTQHPVVRHEAGEALAAIGSASSASILQEFTNDPRPEVADTCRLGVDKIHWLHSADRDEKSGPVLYASIDPAPGSCEKDMAVLSSVLCDKEASLFARYRALFALRDIGGEEAVKAIVKGFESDNDLFRHEIAFALGQMQHPASIPALSAILANTSNHPMVRHEAAEALGSIAQEECQEVLRAHLEDAELIVKESCLIALDIADYEQSGAFQYADGVEQLATPAS